MCILLLYNDILYYVGEFVERDKNIDNEKLNEIENKKNIIKGIDNRIDDTQSKLRELDSCKDAVNNMGRSFDEIIKLMEETFTEGKSKYVIENMKLENKVGISRTLEGIDESISISKKQLNNMYEKYDEEKKELNRLYDELESNPNKKIDDKEKVSE